MTTSDNGFNPTPGPWTVRGSTNYWSVSTVPKTENLGGIIQISDCKLISVVSECDPVEMQSNAALIAQAGTVYGETGKTPRQLADDVARLRAALEAATERMEEVSDGILIEKRQARVSPATHVSHMAGHLAAHARIARAALAATEARHA